jgi:phenylalanyl-tRNA synthetase beta chain
MKFQLGWLREHVDLPESAAEIAERLTAVGLTVDDLVGDGDDAVFDVDIGANRCDAMNHVGIARELAVAFDRELRLPEVGIEEDIEPVDSATSVEVEAPDLCPRYAARVVRYVSVGPGPAWMAARLEACGIRPINVIVDVTNYVLLELGHPLHAFDLSLLAEERIVVRRASEGETLETLDGEQRELWPDALLIADASRGVALAGVMGGANTEIRDETRDVLLESAWFDPVSIRRSSKRVGLHTEASHRFERGADLDVVPLALDRAARLLAELAGGRVLAGRLDVQAAPEPLREVRLSAERLRRHVGEAIPAEFVARTLPALGFELVEGSDEGWMVRVPRRRHDVGRDVDLVEEVLRHWGYDRVAGTLPAFREGARPRRPWELALGRMRQSLVAAGFHQAVSYTFGDPVDMERWAAAMDPAAPRRALRLDNPWAEPFSVMRTSLVPSLLKAISYAVRRGESDLRLFEEGAAYFARRGEAEPGAGPAAEPRHVALVATGAAGPRHFAHRPPAVDLLVVKGAVLDALGALHPRHRIAASVRPADVPGCAPGGAAELSCDGRKVGWIGRVHPELLAPMEIEQPLFAAEVDLESLLPQEPESPGYEAVSKFPRSVRDLSVFVDRNRSYGAIIVAVEALRLGPDGEAIEAVELIDRYLGKGVPDGQVSLTFSVTYRRRDRTLTQEEVDGLHQRLLGTLEESCGARLRG